MAPIDLTLMTYHAQAERAERFNLIEKTVGWGTPLVVAPDKKERDATATLTTSGVIVIRSFDNVIITAYIGTMSQAKTVWERATGNLKMPRSLWLQINYNNNTKLWQKMAA